MSRWRFMKTIKDTPKGTHEEHTDVVSYMENKYPKMTSEFKRFNKNNMNCSYINNKLISSTKYSRWSDVGK